MVVLVVLLVMVVVVAVAEVVVVGSYRVVRIVGRGGRGTHDVRRAGSVGVTRAVGRASWAAFQAVAQLRRLRAVAVVDHQVYRHFAFQTTDVPVAEIVAQLVNLKHIEQNISHMSQLNTLIG